MKKTIGLYYFLYDHQFFTPYNIDHIYDYVDKIIILYGPFKEYVKIKEKLMNIPAEDNTLPILKDYITEKDTVNKISLIEKTEWNGFCDKLETMQSLMDTNWFLGLGPDEFYLDGHFQKIKDIINKHHDSINAVYHSRVDFCHDFHSYWGEGSLKLQNNRIKNEYKNYFEKAIQERIIVDTKDFSVLPFYNDVIAWNNQDISVMLTEGAYKNEEGLYWLAEDYDANLYHYDGTPFQDLNITYFDKNIIRHHYPCVQEPIRHFLIRGVYCEKVRNPNKEIDLIIEEQKEKFPFWNTKEIKEIAFVKNGKRCESGPFDYNGEYPTNIEMHPCFWNLRR